MLPDLRRLTASVSTLIDVTPHGTEGCRVAALLARPLLSGGARPTTDLPVIGIEEGAELVDVALTAVELRPARDDSGIQIALDGRSVDVPPGANVQVSLTPEPGLRCVIGEGRTPTSLEGGHVTLGPCRGSYFLARDGEPIADLDEPVHLAPLPHRLTLLAPRRDTALAG